MSEPVNVDRFSLFDTPVFVFEPGDTDALNRELAARLLAESERPSGISRSEVGGWHSVPDLCQRPDACYQTLMEMIVGRVGQVFGDVAERAGVTPTVGYRFAMQGWAMVLRTGGYAIAHDHATAHWSTAYYVDAGDADEAEFPDSGRLSFIDPRRAIATIPGVDLFPSTFSIKPRTGALAVFPGALQHYVHPYRGTRPRICISCNLRMEPMG